MNWIYGKTTVQHKCYTCNKDKYTSAKTYARFKNIEFHNYKIILKEQVSKIDNTIKKYNIYISLSDNELIDYTGFLILLINNPNISKRYIENQTDLYKILIMRMFCIDNELNSLMDSVIIAYKLAI